MDETAGQPARQEESESSSASRCTEVDDVARRRDSRHRAVDAIAEERDERAAARRRREREDEERRADHGRGRREDYREGHWEQRKGKGKNKRGHKMQRGRTPMQTTIEGEVPGWKVFIGDLPRDMTQDSPG